MLELGRAFIFEAVAWTSAAGTFGVAALDHEIRNHAMERQAIVVAALGEVQEIGNGHWRFGREERGFDGAFVRCENDSDIVHGAGVCGGGSGDCQTEKQSGEESFHHENRKTISRQMAIRQKKEALPCGRASVIGFSFRRLS